MNDERLDWDVWRAFLVYEESFADTKWSDYCQNSAKNLLWGYLDYNATRIRANPKRLAWWIQVITDGMKSPGGRPLRRWFLLELVTATDAKTDQLPEPAEEEKQDKRFPIARANRA